VGHVTSSTFGFKKALSLRRSEIRESNKTEGYCDVSERFDALKRLNVRYFHVKNY
jgi:hypothetical protein